MIGVCRRAIAQSVWSATTPKTQYLVNGSGPHSFVTWIVLESIVVSGRKNTDLWMGFDDSLSSCPMWLFGI